MSLVVGEWRQRDSNSRPPACKAGALPTELYPHLLFFIVLDINSYPMGLSGLEPPTSRLSGVRSNRLSYKPMIWQPPALPCRLQHSTIGRFRLNQRVRDVNGCFPEAHYHQKFFSYLFSRTVSCSPSTPSNPLRFFSGESVAQSVFAFASPDRPVCPVSSCSSGSAR